MQRAAGGQKVMALDMCLSTQLGTGSRALNEPTVMAADAATILFNLIDCRAIATTLTADGYRQVTAVCDQLFVSRFSQVFEPS